MALCGPEVTRQWWEGAGAQKAAERVEIFTSLAWVRKEGRTFQV